MPVPAKLGSRAITKAEVHKRFVHHVPTEKRRPIHEQARILYHDFAHQLAELLPESRETSLALTALEESSFWAHASVARNVDTEGPDGKVDGQEPQEAPGQ